MPPDFLNSREDAILIWAAVLLAILLRTDARMVAKLPLDFMRVLAPKLVALYLLTLGFAALLVYVAWKLGTWHGSALKPTIYWFLGSAVALMGGAVTAGAGSFRRFITGVLRRVLTVTVVVEFVANVYALPLAFEIVGVFLAASLSMVQPLVARDPNADPIQLTLALIPWLFAWARYSRWEQERVRRRWKRANS